MSNFTKFYLAMFVILLVCSLCVCNWDYIPAYKYDPNCLSNVFALCSLIFLHNFVVSRRDKKISDLEDRSKLLVSLLNKK